MTGCALYCNHKDPERMQEMIYSAMQILGNLRKLAVSEMHDPKWYFKTMLMFAYLKMFGY